MVPTQHVENCNCFNGLQSKEASSVHLRKKNSKEEEDLVPTQHVENPPIYPVGIMVTAGSGTLQENWYIRIQPIHVMY